ncbi:imelysin family protein [Stutzerimonas stutzeri]|uniref:imelysin family protein n=1 Tax=Stutzerimonas stutzeri TaxID=316 RepID=UPI001C2E324B|nr:imelysin family protein [Stutzerimonas stutzeri]
MYPNRLISACTLTALGLLLSACAPSDPFAETSKTLVDEVLHPTYTQWAETNRRMAASSIAFCAGNEELSDAREAFLQAQFAWAGLQPMLIGPMGEGNRAWQVQFWPDKKNLVGRQVTALLKNKPELTQADLENGSVVLQGLSAYEYVLYDKAVDLNDSQTKARYCRLLEAVGEHQQKLTADILQQWEGKDGMVAQLSEFPNERYADSQEAIADLLRVQVTALDGLKKKLGAPLGRQSKGIPQPFQAEAWRSDATLGSIDAALAGAQRLWQGNDDNGLKQLVPAQQAELVKRIDVAYATTRKQIADIMVPFSELITDEAGRARLDELYQQIDALHRLHQSDLARALGVQIGFNAHDGD